MAGGNAAAETTTWSLASYTAGGPFLEDVKQLAKNVEFLTEGRLKIEVFPGGTLGHPFKVTETVQKGVAQIGHLWPGIDWGVDKTSVLLAGYPAGPSSEEMLAWVYQGGGLELWQQWRMEKFGLVAFPCNNLTKEVFLHSKKPVRTLQDYQGLKIRTIGAWAPIAEKLGARAVALPPDEIFPALERGVVDAAEWASPAVNLDMGLHKVAKYIILPGIHSTMAIQECVIRKDAWDKLDPRDQKLFETATRLMTAFTWIRLGHQDAETYQEWIKSGNEVINLDPSFIKEIEKVSIEWQNELAAADPWFKRILDSQRAYQKLWSGAPYYH
jgi:TRAP-type mannitol/chloroaromatic compound transport system substrate-binding protein